MIGRVGPNKLSVFSGRLEEDNCNVCQVIDDTIDFMNEWCKSDKLTPKRYNSDEIVYACSDVEKILTNQQVKQILNTDNERKDELIKSIKDFIDTVKEFKLPDYVQQNVEDIDKILQNIQNIIPELKILKWNDYVKRRPNVNTSKEKLKYNYTSEYIHYASKLNIKIEKYNKDLDKNIIDDVERAKMLNNIRIDLIKYAGTLQYCDNFDDVENIVNTQIKQIKGPQNTSSDKITREYFDQLYKEYDELMCSNSDLECMNTDENFLAYQWVNQILHAGTALEMAERGELENAIRRIKNCIEIMREISNEYNGVQTL